MPKEKFHFAVISARRAAKVQGIRDVFMVDSQFKEAGVPPGVTALVETFSSERACLRGVWVGFGSFQWLECAVRALENLLLYH